MMSQAFYTGISGLKANQQAIDVVSDNLANIDTIGFRSYSTEFSSMYEEMIHTSSASTPVNSSIGVGTNVSTISMDQSQGELILTQRSTDVAILGDGWFNVEGNHETYYTRDGSFTFNVDRNLVNDEGFFVLGTMGKNIEDGVLVEELKEIELNDPDTQERLSFPKDLTFPHTPTTEASFSGYLSLGEEQEVAGVSAPIISSNGDKISLKLEFTESSPQPATGSQWDLLARLQSRDGEEVFATDTGVVTFDGSGAFVSNTLSQIDYDGSSIAINLGEDFNGLISYPGKSGAMSSSSNGLESGELFGYDINQNGEVVATFTNGKQSSVGAIGVVHFQNDAGLQRANGSMFLQTANSGAPLFHQDENGKSIIGVSLATNRLENSNVKIEAGMTELIIMQRAYDSNSKVISTVDQMLQKALNMDA